MIESINKKQKEIEKSKIIKLTAKNGYSLEYCDALADRLLAWINDKTNAERFVKAFCIVERITEKTITSKLVKISDKLDKAWALAWDWQESQLVKGGSTARNPAFYVSALKAKHGWKEPQDINITDKRSKRTGKELLKEAAQCRFKLPDSTLERLRRGTNN